MNVTENQPVTFFPSKDYRDKIKGVCKDKTSFAAVIADVNKGSVDLTVFTGGTPAAITVKNVKHKDAAEVGKENAWG